MTYRPRKAKWDWRKFLSDEEKLKLKEADQAKLQWGLLNRGRAQIVNRAIQRAKYAATRPSV